MYNFKVVPEVLWSAGVAAIAFLSEAVTAANFVDVASNPRAWAIAVVAGMGRAAIAVILSKLGNTQGG